MLLLLFCRREWYWIPTSVTTYKNSFLVKIDNFLFAYLYLYVTPIFESATKNIKRSESKKNI